MAVFVNCIYLYIVFGPILQSYLKKREIAFISYLRAFYSMGHGVDICLYTHEYHK